MALLKRVLLVPLILFTLSKTGFAAAPLLETVADIPLPGGTARFDYQSIDPKRGLLFISHMGDGQLIVFDMKQQNVVGIVDQVPGATGVLAVPDLNRVYVSVTGTGEIAVIDEEAKKIVARVAGGTFPDGIAYDPEHQKLFVSDERGEQVVVIDVRTNKQIALIRLGGEVGNTQYDPKSHRIFSNVQSRNQLVSIDPSTHRVVSKFDLKGGDHPHGFLIDPFHPLAFIACDGDSKLLVFDLKTERILQVFPTGKEPDVLAFDAGLGRLYVASESGTLSIFQQEESQMRKEGDLFIAPKAHSVSVDPESHRVYLPIQNLNGRPVLRVMRPSFSPKREDRP